MLLYCAVMLAIYVGFSAFAFLTCCVVLYARLLSPRSLPHAAVERLLLKGPVILYV